MSKSIKDLEMMFNLNFNNFQLLIRAMTHSSFANENNCLSNERLEFIGDAVLDLVVGKFLYDHIPESEGILTKKRAQEVCEDALYNYAKSFNLGDYLLLGKGEELSGGRDKPAVLADAFEAFLGAVYVDKGIKEVYKIVEKVVFPVIIKNLHKEDNDYKSKLQELLQSDKRSLRYEIISESGPAHDKEFIARVFMDDTIKMGDGKGKSKKEAEQNAAFAALQKLANKKI
ncbi:MAG TPA: ribonuclease III [Bacillota bacterium]|jgi:ribonuclease-3|nr:ribonuclease III [Bacillota bacterium]